METPSGILYNKDGSSAESKEAEKLERIAAILKTVAHPMRLGIIH